MKFYIVDCFAENKYQGNQLAVFVPDRDVSTEEMQQIANEVGFSETTFIMSKKEDNGGYHVRIFTPDVEVPFAGHPTLGTAHVIRTVMEDEMCDKVLLNLKVGQIPVEADKNGMIMTQNQPSFGNILEKNTVSKALCIAEDDIRDDYPVQWVSTGLEAIIVPLKSAEAVSRCHVDHYERQKFIDEYYKCNILVFAEEENQIKVRVFMDDTGFLEDPATGSANGDLAAYLLKHEYFDRHEVEYTVSQGSEMGRPSTLYAKAHRDGDRYDIKVGGSAYIVAEGEWK